MDLVSIDSRGHLATPTAAASIARMRAAGMPAGDVTSAYRSDAEQAELRADYLRGEGDYALPAGQSVHRTGNAIDWKSPQYRWLEQHGAEHGWHNPTKAPNYERWHYEHVLANDRHRNDPAPQEDDMTPDQAKQLAELHQMASNIQTAIGSIQTALGTVKNRAERLIKAATRMEKWFRVVAKTRGEEYPK